MDDSNENVKAFSRSDIYYNRDVEKLAVHFDDANNIRERRASTLAMNKYRMSVSGMSSNDNNFGRRLSILSSAEPPAAVMVTKGGVAEKEKKTIKWLPGKDLLMNPKFHLLMMHNFLSYSPSCMPFQFLPSQMGSVGLDSKAASRAVSCMGIAGLAGRLIGGFVMDHPKIGVIKAYAGSQIVAAVAILSFQFCSVEGRQAPVVAEHQFAFKDI